MHVALVKGIGKGQTTLSAFDNALQVVGVSNYNLIVLSSVIPPHTTIEKIDRYHTPDEEWGYKLYVIKAEERSDRVGEALAAGLGYYQLDDDKRGLFVEHESLGTIEEEVRMKVDSDIRKSLEDLCNFRDIPFDPKKVNVEICSAVVQNEPICVLTLAVYESEGWKS